MTILSTTLLTTLIVILLFGIGSVLKTEWNHTLGFEQDRTFFEIWEHQKYQWGWKSVYFPIKFAPSILCSRQEPNYRFVTGICLADSPETRRYVRWLYSGEPE